MSSFLREFREFAVKGNMVDLAVGVIIGAAFGKIVDSIVNDLVMPVIARFTGKIDFSSRFLELTEIPAGVPHTLEAVRKAGIPVIAYGNFFTVAINFLILAFVVFLMVRAINRMRQPDEKKAAPAENVVLLTQIRDLLAARRPL
jgi:large conductance mechanosensitive channel